MADNFAARMARAEINRDRETLARDAQYLVGAATSFAAHIRAGHEPPDDMIRILTSDDELAVYYETEGN